MPKKKIRLNGIVTAYFRFRGVDLNRAREAAGLTEQQLAEKIGFWSQQYISHLEAEDPHKLHTITLEERKIINKSLNFTSLTC